MKKKLDIPKDFWKDFKDRKDFDEFFSELSKEGINQMLKSEMTDHLGYEKHSKEGDNNAAISRANLENSVSILQQTKYNL